MKLAQALALRRFFLGLSQVLFLLDLGIRYSANRTTSAAGSSHTPLIVWNETLLIHISTGVQSSQIKFSPWPNNQIG